MSHHKFVKNSLIFTLGNVFVIFLNYGMMALMARFMSHTMFGEVNTLMAIFRYVLTLGMAFYLAFSHYISTEGEQEALPLFLWLEKFLFFSGLAIFLCFSLFNETLNHFFHLQTTQGFFLLGLIFLVALLLPISRGYLAGRKQFGYLTLNSNIEALVKLLVFAVFVFMGEPFLGAFAGVFLGIVIAYGSNRWLIRQSIPHSLSLKKLPIERLQPFLKHVFYILLASGMVTAFYNLDIVLFQRINPEMTADYVVINKMAQIIFLVTNSLMVVMFPEIKKGQWKETLKKIKSTLLLTFILSVFAWLGFLLLGRLAIVILFGETYSNLSIYLSYSVLLGFFLSVINLATHYFLGRKSSFYYLGILFLGLTMVFLSGVYFGQSLLTYLLAMLMSLGICATLMIAATFWDIKRSSARFPEASLVLMPE